ncbi:hypothetical protein H2200_004615 [Cladophialophora chaetospira]|uniref:T6SS Phospholipase effector Tle1-like catalytic domain-containing protein n=1 Tax=Cladophialophora chaetospira TaxID=386627 RepID=A0AA39CKN8_9EURO|nr:hypothetical protein H2200_004615 [Cladophialophora chaetospira]
MIGIDPTVTDQTYTSPAGDVHAKYFQGVGLGGSFMSYLWDGAFATHVKNDCTDVYKHIVQHFEPGHEVWMFGISRGAYIVRSVAGMINNCGIVRDRTNHDLIDQIHGLYRSPYPVNKPGSTEMQHFRTRVSHHVRTPIKFMGLFDTVGSLGIPKLNYDTGVGFEWPEFHDNLVSSTVEKVYHALATHDRMWAFQPCLASRDPKHKGSPDLRIYQKWFPGCHYDLARQEFQFLREGHAGLEGKVASILNFFSKTIHPNEQLSDLVLLWMLQGIRAEGGGSMIRYDMNTATTDIAHNINDLRNSCAAARTGTGDVYDDIFEFLPLSKLFRLPRWPLRWYNSTLYKALLDTRDRTIPDIGNPISPLVQNQVYDYTVADPDIANSIIGDTAEVKPPRYPSKTFQNYLAYMRATGR